MARKQIRVKKGKFKDEVKILRGKEIEVEEERLKEKFKGTGGRIDLTPEQRAEIKKGIQGEVRAILGKSASGRNILEEQKREELGIETKAAKEDKLRKEEGDKKEKGFIASTVEGGRKVLGAATTGIIGLTGQDVSNARAVWGLDDDVPLWKDRDVQSLAITLGSLGIGAVVGKVVGVLRASSFTGAAGGQFVRANAIGATSGKIATATKFLQNATPQTIRNLFAGGWKSPAVKIGGAVSGVSVISTWLASDNILTGMGFTARKVREARDVGALTTSEALAQLDDLDITRGQATSFVKGNVYGNPALWLFAKQYLVNAEKAKIDLDLERQLLLAT